jgi:hypothetical protein
MSDLPFRVIQVSGKEFVEIPQDWPDVDLDSDLRRRLSLALAGRFPAYPVLHKVNGEPRVVPGYRIPLEELS